MEKLTIIKIGGNIIDDEVKLSLFLQQFGSLPGKKILVHGGGILATRLAEQLHIPQQIIDGRRITDKDTLRVVIMVYAGFINKNIVAQLQAHGCNALGLCGADGNAVLAHKRNHPDIDYGFAGDIDKINTGLLEDLLQQDMALVLAPLTHDKNGQLLNTNADTMAQELAKALSIHFDTTLIYLFEKSGVLLDSENNDTVIPKINPSFYHQLKEEGRIFAGMIPKLDNAFAALDGGIKKVIIGKAEELKDLVQGKKGTSITNE